MTPDSNSPSHILAHWSDGGGRHDVVAVFGMLMGSLLEKMTIDVIPRIRYENGQN